MCFTLRDRVNRLSLKLVLSYNLCGPYLYGDIRVKEISNKMSTEDAFKDIYVKNIFYSRGLLDIFVRHFINHDSVQASLINWRQLGDET